MALDLSPGRRALERLMEDTCLITLDASGTSDDAFDQTTGLHTPPPGDVRTVYDGKCLLTSQGNVGREGNRGGGSFQVTGYTLQIPLSAPALPVGAAVQLTASRRDPNLVGRRFRIDRTTYSTTAITRKASLIAEEEVPAE